MKDEEQKRGGNRTTAPVHVLFTVHTWPRKQKRNEKVKEEPLLQLSDVNYTRKQQTTTTTTTAQKQMMTSSKTLKWIPWQQDIRAVCNQVW